MCTYALQLNHPPTFTDIRKQLYLFNHTSPSNINKTWKTMNIIKDCLFLAQFKNLILVANCPQPTHMCIPPHVPFTRFHIQNYGSHLLISIPRFSGNFFDMSLFSFVGLWFVRLIVNKLVWNDRVSVTVLLVFVVFLLVFLCCGWFPKGWTVLWYEWRTNRYGTGFIIGTIVLLNFVFNYTYFTRELLLYCGCIYIHLNVLYTLIVRQNYL